MSTSVDYSFDDMMRGPVAPDDPVILEAMYKSGTKPGEDRGTRREKAACKAYYDRRRAGAPAPDE